MSRPKYLPAILLDKVKAGYKHLFGNVDTQATIRIVKDMDSICSAFLSRNQFKYGYMGAAGIHRLHTEARQGIMDNQPMIDELKAGKITARLIAYLFISERCQSFLHSGQSHTEQGVFNADGEAVFHLLKFTLDGLLQERFLDKAAVRDIMDSLGPDIKKNTSKDKG